VNGHIFLNNTGLGLYPDMVHQRERRQQRGAGKWTSAIREGFRALMRYRLLGVRIIVNGETLLRRTPAVMVTDLSRRLEQWSRSVTSASRPRLVVHLAEPENGGVWPVSVPAPAGQGQPGPIDTAPRTGGPANRAVEASWTRPRRGGKARGFC